MFTFSSGLVASCFMNTIIWLTRISLSFSKM